MKEAIGDYLTSLVGFALLMVMLYAAPIYILEKLVGMKPATKTVIKNGEKLEVLNVKQYLLFATIFWVVVYGFSQGWFFPSDY